MLEYSAFLATRTVYDYKHANFSAIRFEFGAHALTVAQDRRLGRGGMVFDAAFVLADFLLSDGDAALRGMYARVCRCECRLQREELAPGTEPPRADPRRAQLLTPSSRWRRGAGPVEEYEYLWPVREGWLLILTHKTRLSVRRHN